MLHTSSSHHFQRVVRGVASVLDASNDTIPVLSPSDNQTAPAPPPSGPDPDTLNGQAANMVDFALLIGVSIFFLFAAPSIGSWIASGKFTRGWWLSGRTRVEQKEDSFASSLSKNGLQRVGSIESRPPRKVRIVGAAYANWTYWSNRLLPNFPFPYMSLTIGQTLVALGYIVLVVLAVALHAQMPLTDNYNLPAMVAVAQLPAVILLASKNSLIGVIGKAYERLNFLHRVAGRCLFVCAALHVLLYFMSSDSTDNVTTYTGVASIGGLGLIVLTSIPYFRRAFYQTFIYCHVVGWLTFVIALTYHAPGTVNPYTIGSIGIYLLDWFIRIALTRFRSATLMSLKGGMTMIQVHGLSTGWRAGQHVYVRVLNGRRGFENHPFTVANAPASASPLPGEHSLTLLAKSAGNWTTSLREFAETKATAVGNSEKNAFGYGRVANVIIQGPYGGTGFTDLSESQAVLLIAGGSGITFCASLLEEILGQAVEGRGVTQFVTLVWSIKSINCVDWYQHFFNQLLLIAQTQTNVKVHLKVHLTGPGQVDFVPVNGASLFRNRVDIPALVNEVCDEVLENVASKGAERGGGVKIGICGPTILVKNLRRAVADVPRDRTVKVGGILAHSETFG